LGDGFEDSEFKIPYEKMKNAGITVEIIGVENGKEIKGKNGQVVVRAEKSIDEVRPEDYDALFIPGGYSPDHLRADQRFVDFVKRFDQLKRPLFAICHGPQLLMSAGLVKGRTLTAWKTIQDDLRLMGANVKDEPVVIDGNWITSRKPQDLEQFSQAILEVLRR
jgi:protease I